MSCAPCCMPACSPRSLTPQAVRLRQALQPVLQWRKPHRPKWPASALPTCTSAPSQTNWNMSSDVWGPDKRWCFEGLGFSLDVLPEELFAQSFRLSIICSD